MGAEFNVLCDERSFVRPRNSEIRVSSVILPVRWKLERERTPMTKFTESVKRFLVSEDGPTAVEYAVMLALIVIVCLTAIQAIGTNAGERGSIRDARGDVGKADAHDGQLSLHAPSSVRHHRVDYRRRDGRGVRRRGRGGGRGWGL